MSARRIVGLPVDARPVVREQVQMLVASAGWELVVPAVEQLGHLRRGADRARLAAWLDEQAAEADGFVLSLDMLAYGGLVPSRFIDDSLAQLEAWLALLPALRLRYPDKPIYAFSATMRISNNNVNEEEKLYWSSHGAAIWRWSHLSDRHAQLGDAADGAAAEAAAAAIPQDIRDDYLATRARNFALTGKALQMVADGTIDRLVLPQDDTADFGFNIAERRAFEARIGELDCAARVLVYPGADEVMHTLCAHMVAMLEGDKPLSFHVMCSDPAHVTDLRALYEDRPVLDAVRSQLAAVGAVVSERAEDADIILGVHTCGAGQGDWAMQKPLPQPQPVDGAWTAALAQWQCAGKAVAVLDLAYANGGDPALIGALSAALPLSSLAAYAGWNTASNSIGSLVAQCVLARGEHRDKQILTLRLLEDFLYQAVLRQTVRHSVVEADCSAAALRGQVERVFRAHADAWAGAHQLGYEVSDIYLPWDRTFEIGLRLRRST